MKIHPSSGQNAAARCAQALAFLTLLGSLAGCQLPAHCNKNARDLECKSGRIDHFQTVRKVAAGHTTWTVLQSRQRYGPPVVLLPELPAVSSALLDLGKRLEGAGFTVYIPVMFGKETDDASSQALAIGRSVALIASPRWWAAGLEAPRPACEDLAAFTSSYVLARHPGQRVGMIGNCLTGTFPYAIAARLPALAAPIASQPALPILHPDWLPPASGLTKAELHALDARAADPFFQMLGFRFAGDVVSHGNRFDLLGKRYPSPFIGYQFQPGLYVDHDCLPLKAHTVLTGCYWKDGPVSTQFAWEETQRFLHAKLDGKSPRVFLPRPIPPGSAKAGAPPQAACAESRRL